MILKKYRVGSSIDYRINVYSLINGCRCNKYTIQINLFLKSRQNKITTCLRKVNFYWLFKKYIDIGNVWVIFLKKIADIVKLNYKRSREKFKNV